MVRGVVTICLLLLNLLVWGTPVFLSGLVKLFVPGRRRRDIVEWVARNLADRWVAVNNRIFDLLLPTKWDIDGIGGTAYDARYLIVSNHVSWVDIFAVSRAFHGRTAFIRFFLKQQLIWFPIVGQASWALDFPFMKRHTPEFLAQHPEKRGEDLETTRVACRRYRKLPVAILNFIEGTRFTLDKQADQESPYRHLLRPRIGGIAFVLAALGEHLDALFDVTISYPPRGDVTMWDFVCGRLPRIVLHARRVEVPPKFFDAAVTRPGPEREELKAWIDGLWLEKDALLDEMLGGTENAE